MRSLLRLNEGQRFPLRVASLPGNLFLEKIGHALDVLDHVLRLGENVPVDTLENEMLLPRRNQIGVVDVAVAIRFGRPRAIRNIKLEDDAFDMLIHVNFPLSRLTATAPPLEGGAIFFN